MNFEEMSSKDLEREYKIAMSKVAPYFGPIYEHLKRELQSVAFSGDYEKLKHHYSYLNELHLLMENHNAN